jgi:DNA-binding IclR family transcriptional regulator
MQNGVATVGRALSILGAFREGEAALSLASALGISGPRERIASREDAHRATVAHAAADLTRRLGGDLGVSA